VLVTGTLTIVPVLPAAAAPCDPPVVSPVACENTKTGNPVSEWGISGAGSSSIQGFATDISVDQGGTIGFKVDTLATSYRLDIYRMGFYNGLGARKVTTLTPSGNSNQPACITAVATGLVDCGNWTQNASWTVPTDAVSGIYFANLVRTDGTAGSSHTFFVVRDDDGGSKLLFQTSDTTWQAYNAYGGNSLYTGAPAGRAYKVSYNRPFTTRQNAPEDWVFNAEYPMVRWLESNGYDVSYTSGVDTDRRGAELLEHKVFMSVGHDEYWSGAQRANVEAARAAGVNLAFFSGNEMFWKTRWENSIDGSGTPYRTLVTYKETHANAVIDPQDPPTWTGTWRDPRFSPPADGGRPENAVSGQIFTINCCAVNMVLGSADGKMRFWRNTRVATLGTNATTTIGSNIIGYEWDEDLDNGSRPAGAFRLSETAGSGDKLQDYGTNYATGAATHSMTMYKAPSGALVFGAGTIQWSWALDSNHDRGSAAADVAAQQATVNLLADMGVQPTTLRSGLVAATASSDTVAPTSTITSPANGATVPVGTPLTVTGTAVDTGGGRIGGVEVSTDNGATWHRATGRESWSYAFTPSTAGSITIRSRATDDSANIQTPGAGVTVTVGSGSVTCPCTIWPGTATPAGTDPDTSSVELGVKFRAATSGFVTGIRFYKAATSTGTHVGTLWTGTGTKLGTVTFIGETASGWQQATFASPIAVTANTTYVASYFTPSRYSVSGAYFASAPTVRGPLTALQNGTDGGNGVYRYGSTAGSFPNNTYNSENYWVDVVFADTDTTKPTVTSKTPAAGATNVPVTTTATGVFSEPVQQATISFVLRDPANAVVPATLGYNAGTNTATLTPNAPLAPTTTYTATLSGAKDTAGNTMDPVSWSFTTETPDTTKPTVTSKTPAAGATNVPVTTTATGVFSETVQQATIGFTLRDAASNPVAATTAYNAATRTVTLTPNAALANSATYTATLSGATDPAGNVMDPVTWSFTTEAPETVKPTVTSKTPAAGATAVPVTTSATAVFSEPVQPATISFVLRDPANNPVVAATTYDSATRTATLTPTASLAPGTTYTATVSGTQDIVGNVMDPVSWSFTTDVPDTTKPTVTSRTPAPGATGVATGTTVTGVFSEAVQQATISFVLRNPSLSVVPSTTSYNAATRTATLTPSAALAVGTTYTATLSGATDTAGNVMDTVSWSFTTTASTFSCPCTIWPTTATPQKTDPDTSSVELGVKFRATVSGYVTGIRYYKPSAASGTHVGTMWTGTGTKLGTATFTGETASGWQQATFTSPIPVTANTTYVASYFAPSRYAVSSAYFATAATTRGPLTALRNGTDGGNGLYRYGASAGSFPTGSYDSENYWVDVVFSETSNDTVAPTVTDRVPTTGSIGVPVSIRPTATFSESVTPASISMVLRDDANQVVPSTTSWDVATSTATLTPSSALAYSTNYAVSLSGAADPSGNVMAPTTWTFQTSAPPPPPIDAGPGGPIALVTSDANKSSSYLAEIVRAEGLNDFAVLKNTSMSATTLAPYDVVVLGDVAITDPQVTALTDWVNAGGNLIILKPDARLLGLAGLTSASGTVSNGYLAVNGASEPGAGITTETMQFHGTANRYTLSGATSVAALYTTATASTGGPAVSLRSVGANGGQVATFAYDLAQSVIQTRQGNLAWAGQDRDSNAPIRSDDLFFGGASTDWVNLGKVHIPQADEQQRLLANLVTVMERDRLPMPRFWYFPKTYKAVLVATGDDHAGGGTAGRMSTYAAASTSGCSVALWECARFTSYIYPSSPLTNTQASSYNGQGFEIGLHPQNGCANYTSLANLQSTYTSQLADWKSTYTSVPSPTTNRYHCIVWSDWASQPKAELANGMRLDANYYYYPGSWLQDRPGFMNGSGMPMRFTDTDGSMIDVYQTNTAMTDESGQSYPFTPNTLFDRALGPLGYYGAFTANLHTDVDTTFEDTQALSSAQSRGVPVIAARQLLTWTDGRNASSFSGLAWTTDTLTFTVGVGVGATALTGMVPTSGPGGRTLSSISRGGSPVTFTLMTVKGQQYAMFSASAGTYQATYAVAGGAPSMSPAQSSGLTDDAVTLAWRTGEPATTSLLLGTSPRALATSETVAERTQTHRITTDGLRPDQRYFYRIVSRDSSGDVRVWPARDKAPAMFTTRRADTKAPRIHGVRALSLPDGTATVTWSTDEPSASIVRFGTSRTRLDSHRIDGTATRRHAVVLTGLEPGQVYWLRAGSTDPSGNKSSARRTVRLRTVGGGVASQTATEFRTGRSSGAMYVSSAGFGALTLRGPGAGTHVSAVIDTVQKVAWGQAVVHASVPSGSRLAVYARTGSTPVPNGTWSAWTRTRTGAPLRLAGRYLQYRVELSASTADVPSVTAVGFTNSGSVHSEHELPQSHRITRTSRAV
jgi:hypothetical protein